MVSKNRGILGFLCSSQVLITMVPRKIVGLINSRFPEVPTTRLYWVSTLQGGMIECGIHLFLVGGPHSAGDG